MDVPHKIRITSKTAYIVGFVPGFDDKKQVGSCDPNTKRIDLLESLNAEKTIGALLHEVIHAINFEDPDLALVERQVEILELRLLFLLKKNPKFKNLLLELK